MDVLQAIVLALTQGLTEFLPISSAAHLILMPRLLGWSDQGLAFDVSVHVGTLAAVLWYFREEIRGMLRDWLRSLLVRRRVGDSHLAWAVLWGTVPVGLAGLAAANLVETHLRSPIVIALATLAFGLLLWWADRAGARQRSEHQLTWKDVLVVGCAQAVALIPGTSRSGITMTAGLMLGLTRAGAARFSFLLSIPVIILAGMLTTLELVESGNHVSWSLLWLGAAVSAVSAYLCIKLFLSLLERIGMLPFVIYRMVLGVVLLVLFV